MNKTNIPPINVKMSKYITQNLFVIVPSKIDISNVCEINVNPKVRGLIDFKKIKEAKKLKIKIVVIIQNIVY